MDRAIVCSFVCGRPFKDGAYNLAAELGLSVLPVTIHIREDIWLNGSKLKVTIHDALPTSHDTKQQVKEASFKAIMDCLAREQQAEAADGTGKSGDNDDDDDNDGGDNDDNDHQDGEDASTSSVAGKGALNTANKGKQQPQNVKQRRGRGTALILKASSVAS